jgi:hypothetical protein
MPALTLYGCSVGFSWIDHEDVTDALYLTNYGDCLVAENMFDDTARRPVNFQAAWVGF